MTGEDLRRQAVFLFGRWGWVSATARWLKVDRSTIYRWLSGVEVPGPVEAAITLAVRRFIDTGERPGD